ncbi:hypothetical protein O0L34_g2121 [Tuta absoluta]|nr:hypothetical protein O0L34_g2121 [Tuta absoluta]
MDPLLSSDDSGDSEIKNMKSQLSEFGLDEENLSKEEMCDLLKALNNSKTSVKEDELLRQNVNVEDNSASTSPKKTMKRRYLNVIDRRMPWSLLPSTITQAEKARVLAVYIKLMSINTYRQARQSPNFMTWPPPLQIVEETISTRSQPMRSTRSGRTVPIYAGFDDDSSDLDFVATKTKKRKISSSEGSEGTNMGKTISLKRKSLKDENTRPVKEVKLNSDNNKAETSTSQNNTKTIFTLIED